MSKFYFAVGVQGQTDVGYLKADGSIAVSRLEQRLFVDRAEAEAAANAWLARKPAQTSIERRLKRPVRPHAARIGYANAPT